MNSVILECLGSIIKIESKLSINKGLVYTNPKTVIMNKVTFNKDNDSNINVTSATYTYPNDEVLDIILSDNIESKLVIVL